MRSNPGSTIEIGLPINDLAYYDVGQASWVVEPLEHEVHVGTSSRDLPLSASLTIASDGLLRLD